MSVIKEILTDYSPKYTSGNLLCLYMLTGGVPKYIELLMEVGAVTKDKILDMVTPVLILLIIGEGKELLITEFGKEYST